MIHITLLASNNYGNLGKVRAFADQRGGDLLMIRRREFIASLGGAAAWPLAGRAQQSIPVIGYLSAASANDSLSLAPFLQGLKESGFVEGQNVNVEYRWADGHYDRLPAMAADLVNRRVAVISTNGGVFVASVGSSLGEAG